MRCLLNIEKEDLDVVQQYKGPIARVNHYN